MNASKARCAAELRQASDQSQAGHCDRALRGKTRRWARCRARRRNRPHKANVRLSATACGLHCRAHELRTSFPFRPVRRCRVVAGALVTAVPTGASPMDSLPTMDVVRPQARTDARPGSEAQAARSSSGWPNCSRRGFASSRLRPQGDKRAVLRDAKQQADTFNSKVEDALTPSQETKWRELRAETREKLKQRYEDKHE